MTTSLSARLSPFRRIQPWLVVFSASLFFFFEFLQMNMFNALDPSLYKAFHLTDATQLGQLSACFMVSMVLFLFPAGMILDRFSTKTIILLSMFSCIAFVFLFSFTTSLFQGEICRLITGIGDAFCLLACVRLASRWFPPKHMALIVGLIVTFAMIGGMVAQTPLTELTKMIGWRTALRLDAATGVFMWIIILFLVKDFPAGTKAFFQAQHASLEKLGFFHALTRTITNLQNWLGGLFVSLVNLPLMLLGSTWGGFYLTQTQHLSTINASVVDSLLFLGMIIGSPVVGWISDKLERRKMPMIVGTLASLAIVLMIMYLPNLSFDDLKILFFVMGFAISSQIIGYPLVAESNPSILTGTAEGLASVLIMSGGFLIPVFPMLLNLHWNHAMKNGIPQYALQDYHLAFLIMPVAFLIALIAAFSVKETRCRSFEEKKNKAEKATAKQSAELLKA
ncbi:MAG: MFS transporter [Gammaproteobacteria bacterium RIFCSPHIGHO2_12_FULL_40_19]|nr:MAG: MFS transporter [Gammaproteobacteria bacterium RIFCSPHIGHO2_12_FULL_40_19]